MTLFLITGAYAQSFGDLPFANPDAMTYFQQEMTSLMRFQAKNNINIPFFISGSLQGTSFKFDFDKASSVVPNWDTAYADAPSQSGGHNYLDISSINTVFGFQIKINNSLYIPVLGCFGGGMGSGIADKGMLVNNEYHVPIIAQWDTQDSFFGGGVFINSEILKGGIYAGTGFYGSSTTFNGSWGGGTIHDSNNDFGWNFKIALVPIVNTAGWAYVGRILNNFLAFAGLGENIVNSPEAESGSEFAALISALNLALDLSFNKIHFDYLSLDTMAYYKRANYDAAAKVNAYGLKIQGIFPRLPLGFSLEGGYQHFYSVSQWHGANYHDTGFFTGNIFIKFGRSVILDLVYQYDAVEKSRFTVGLSTNFLSGFMSIGRYKAERSIDGYPVPAEGSYGDLGGRFRWGGWKVKY